MTKNKTGNYTANNLQTDLPLIHMINMRLTAGGPGGPHHLSGAAWELRCPPERQMVFTKEERSCPPFPVLI